MTNPRPTWKSPWGYAEGIWVAVGLCIVGLGLQLSGHPLDPRALAWPVNLVLALAFTLALVLAHLFGRRSPWVNWLGRVPAALCSIALITLLVLIMGLVLQDDSTASPLVRRLGLSSMTRNWVFLFAMFWFLAALGIATLKRMIPWSWKNLGYLLNHLGLYIAVLGALLGAADVQRLLMESREGEITWLATDPHGHVYEMPLAIELIRFEKEEFPPKLAAVETESHRMAPHSKLDMFEATSGHSGTIHGWQVTVHEAHSLSMPVEDLFVPVYDLGAGPSARVTAHHPETGETREGWISCGSFAFPHRLLELDETYSLAMTVPRASAYRSRIRLFTPDHEPREALVEVNKPLTVGEWKVYQHSYDDRFGRWSTTSIFELILDPWLPVVYTGIFMLLAGSLYLMFKRRIARPSAANGDDHDPA
ncbi:MAG TPA: cytochrome c biogenesis protein ResB [Kiritimatiellia bacterium]|nr:cytochrome c biogenesis protein ResB [Kiritimatiellia bacterium]